MIYIPCHCTLCPWRLLWQKHKKKWETQTRRNSKGRSKSCAFLGLTIFRLIKIAPREVARIIDHDPLTFYYRNGGHPLSLSSRCWFSLSLSVLALQTTVSSVYHLPQDTITRRYPRRREGIPPLAEKSRTLSEPHEREHTSTHTSQGSSGSGFVRPPLTTVERALGESGQE